MHNVFLNKNSSNKVTTPTVNIYLHTCGEENRETSNQQSISNSPGQKQEAHTPLGREAMGQDEQMGSRKATVKSDL